MKHLSNKSTRVLVMTLALVAWGCVAWAQTPSYSIIAGDTTCQVFIYSPGERDGLHLAFHAEDDTWQEVGQLCSSDYGQWGAEKRMYKPSVVHANDGSWRLVFGVNDHAPCFAAAFSEDLITWRPQDYPLMSQKGCLEPIVFAMDDGTFDIYYKDRAGQKHYVQASADFRHFTEDSLLSSIDDVAWLRDSVTVVPRGKQEGKMQEGNLFDVPKVHLDFIRQWFHALAKEDELNRETMRDDATRFASLPATVKATLKVDASAEKPISDKLIGVFFEDISYAADGGLYAELIQNRDFEYTSKDHRGWHTLTAWNTSAGVRLTTDQPLSTNNPHHVVMDADTLLNSGWDGIIDEGARYNFSCYIRLIGCQKKQFMVALVAEDGTVMGEGKLKAEGEGWQRYTLVLDTDKKLKRQQAAVITDEDVKRCQLRIVGKKGGQAALDMISLFPQDTYKGHGLRKDLAETIAALKPKFVRFPGGCMTHGQGLDNIYHWNETVGPWQDRKPDLNIWNYHQTRGLGFYEYFQFCEDIGAEPLPVLAAGVPCQNSAANADGFGGQQGGIPMADMPAYIDELCNLIEWANGDPVKSKWAKMRADAGHPAPFNMKYLGIGNEDIISTVFEERCEMIAKALRERHPEIFLCGTAGPFHFPSADYIEGWEFANKHKDLFHMIDEHYYESPAWFIHHQDYYDHYDRKGPKVYVGEYASRTRTHESALAEALYLCNIERNGDIVEMSSYAPLLAKEGHHNWNPDMIYFDNTSVQLTPSYHTQHLFGNHSGDRYVSSMLTVDGLQMTDDSMLLRMASSVVRDSKTGATYLKLVNALPRELSIDVEGLAIDYSNAHIEAFTAQPADKTVTFYNDDAHLSAERCVEISGKRVTLMPYTVCAIKF
ncbi:MAG: alpha-N-arabinofuranosidase [Prevotella sp.]|nr:alpha-N-arabinofuranosidase [Prevotella sp.]